MTIFLKGEKGFRVNIGRWAVDILQRFTYLTQTGKSKINYFGQNKFLGKKVTSLNKLNGQEPGISQQQRCRPMSPQNNRPLHGFSYAQIKLETKYALNTLELCEVPWKLGSDMILTDAEFVPPWQSKNWSQ